MIELNVISYIFFFCFASLCSILPTRSIRAWAIAFTSPSGDHFVWNKYLILRWWNIVVHQQNSHRFAAHIILLLLFNVFFRLLLIMARLCNVLLMPKYRRAAIFNNYNTGNIINYVGSGSNMVWQLIESQILLYSMYKLRSVLHKLRSKTTHKMYSKLKSILNLLYEKL